MANIVEKQCKKCGNQIRKETSVKSDWINSFCKKCSGLQRKEDYQKRKKSGENSKHKKSSFSRWSFAEMEWLLENYDNETSYLMNSLARDEADIVEMIHLLKLDRSETLKNVSVVRICKMCHSAFIANSYEEHRHGIALYCSNQCCAKSRKVKVPSKKKLIIDYEQGLSTNDIAEKYKISKGTVYNLFKKHNIKTRDLSMSLQTFFTTEKGQEAIQSRLKTCVEKYNTVCFGHISKYGRTHLKSGWKEDLQVSVRSGWESNFLRYLNFLEKSWEYEPKTFIFKDEIRGARAYMPDIYLPKENIWIEIKGWMSSKDRSKIRKFKKFYPEEFKKLQMVVGSSKTEAFKFASEMGIPIFAFYNDIQKDYGSQILNWE